MKTGLIPYSYHSESCLKLREHLGNFSYNEPEDILINFGSTQKFNCNTKIYINHPMNVKVACSKLATFNKLKGKVNIPKFTNDIYKVDKLLKYPIFMRETLTGSQGKGIVVVNTKRELYVAPLYVEHIKNSREHRLIIVGGTVVVHMQKYKRKESCDNLVQNLENGYKYSYKVRIGTDKISCKQIAIETLRVLGLQFGAVDIIMDEKGTPYVLEVNTAFGLGKRNVEKVARALEEVVANVGMFDKVKTYFKNVYWGVVR